MATEPAFTGRLSRLLGIYQSVPVGVRLPSGLEATPGALDQLPTTLFAEQKQTAAKLGPDPKDACQVLGPFRFMARPDVKL